MNSHLSRMLSLSKLILMDVTFLILSRPGSVCGHVPVGSSAPGSDSAEDYGPVYLGKITTYIRCKYQERGIEQPLKITVISGSYHMIFLMLLVVGSSAPSSLLIFERMINLNLLTDYLAGSPAVGPAFTFIYMYYIVNLHVIIIYGSSALSSCCFSNYSTYDAIVDLDIIYEIACYIILMCIFVIFPVINFSYSGGCPVVGPPFSKLSLFVQNLHEGLYVDMYLCNVYVYCYCAFHGFLSNKLIFDFLSRYLPGGEIPRCADISWGNYL